MKPLELHIEISTVSACRKAFTCDYCQTTVETNNPYTKIQTRKEDERFPVVLKICKKHVVQLLPLSLLWNRKT
jgi:hypothetical protein